MRPVGERADVTVTVQRPENPDDEGLGGRFGERVSIKDDDSGDLGGWDFVGEEIDDEDPGSDEEDVAGGVEGVTVVGREVGGDLGGDLGELGV